MTLSPSVQVPAGLTISQASRAARVYRNPRHDFHTFNQQPFEIQPVAIAPVLAGETMKNAVMEARMVTNPVRNRLIGWWSEYSLYYVRLRDLVLLNGGDASRPAVEKMLLDMGYDIRTGNTSAAAAERYHADTGNIDWLHHCMTQIVDHYWRSGEDATNIAMIGNNYMASLKGRNGIHDSLFSTGELEDVEVPAGPTMNELSTLEHTWLMLRQAQMTDMTYEDYVEQFGVRRAQLEELGKPELLRVWSEWAYPSNTIADDGSASSALSWTAKGRADKDRFFKEPGFLVTVSCARPKVYLGKQKEAAIHVMNDALSWLPATLKDQVWSSIRNFDAGTGIYADIDFGDDGATPTPNEYGYTLDIRDLFIYGDQFVDDLTKTDGNFVTAPAGSHRSDQYPTTNDINALFAGETGGRIEQDGYISFSILGTQVDHT